MTTETHLLYKIAKAYYEDGLTQDQIGKRFGLSRIKISRLLQQARQTRVVQIAITPPSGSYGDLERAVEAAYGLDEVVVAADGAQQAAVVPLLGQAAAAYLARCLSDGQILAWFVYQSRSSPEKEMLSGELALDEKRCLRLKEYLLILPPDTYLREDPLRLVDGDLEPIAQIGEAVQVTGAERKAGDYRYFDNKVQCAGPYWGVNQITAAE